MKTYFEHIGNKFLSFTIVDALLILFFTVLLCFLLIYAKNHNAKSFSHFIIGYFALVIIVGAFNVYSSTISLLLFVSLPVILTFILFGPELKRDLFKISWKNYSNYLHNNLIVNPEDVEHSVASMIKAMQSLSKQDTGALIIVVPDTISDHILESGTRLQADISSELIESIFTKDTPMHDGAIIVKGNKILAAGCYLPLSQSTNIPKELGTRHRGAIGMTETNPSVTAFVVSEETGIISAMYDGHIKRYLDNESLRAALEAAYLLDKGSTQKSFWRMDINEEE